MLSKKLDVINCLDLESSCWAQKPGPEGQTQEIIEVGIVEINLTTRSIGKKKSIIVKPCFSTISEFCTSLTGHTQERVNQGVLWPEACQILQDEFKSKSRVWMAWGNYDQKQVEKNCLLYNCPNPFGGQYVNIKPILCWKAGLGKTRGLGNTMKAANLEFLGPAHRGDVDAYNTARLFLKLL